MSRISKLPSAVVDTNLIVSGLILKHGYPYELVEALRHGAFTLLVSEALQEEYKQVLARPRLVERYGLTREEVADFLSLVEMTGHKVAPRHNLPVQIRDPKDEKVLAAALGGKADYLVTGDDDLLGLRGDPKLGGLKIVTVKTFLDALQQ